MIILSLSLSKPSDKNASLIFTEVHGRGTSLTFFWGTRTNHFASLNFCHSIYFTAPGTTTRLIVTSFPFPNGTEILGQWALCFSSFSTWSNLSKFWQVVDTHEIQHQSKVKQIYMLKFFYLLDCNKDISFPPYFYSLQTHPYIPPFSLSHSLPVSFSLIAVIFVAQIFS